MTDRIELRGLRVAAICGVLPEERERPQPLEVDLDLVADLSEAGGTDDLAATIDYGRVCADVDQVIAELRPQLLERLAEKIAEAVLAHDRVQEVTVAVRKLRPPVPQQLATSGVRITRRRPGGP
jgi:7,8-dihydroneopterin aldolase/epimerase/oxygenase